MKSMADETQDDPAADLYGRVIALEALVTRLLASHAQMYPRGVAARMLADIDGVVENVKCSSLNLIGQLASGDRSGSSV